MLLISTLVAELLFGLLAFLLGAIVALSLDWLSMRGRWNGSQLPETDPAYDWELDGWWVDDPEWYPNWPQVAPDELIRRWAYRTHDKTQTQFLLTHELVVRPQLSIWHVIEGARR